MFKSITIPLILTAVCVMTGSFADAQSKDRLFFPKNTFTVETRIVKTSAGEKKVTYHSYRHIPYVANPVDKEYQSLNVSVPVKMDNVDIDASNAPILFVIGVGGYMSVNNAHGGGMGGPVGPGGTMIMDPAASQGGFHSPTTQPMWAG